MIRSIRIKIIHTWRRYVKCGSNPFTVPQVAALVLRYFRADTQLDQSLAEHFSEAHLAFCYNKREVEMRCMTQFREVVEKHVQVHGPLSTSDHAALTLILEIKMPLNGAITAK